MFIFDTRNPTIGSYQPKVPKKEMVSHPFTIDLNVEILKQLLLQLVTMSSYLKWHYCLEKCRTLCRHLVRAWYVMRTVKHSNVFRIAFGLFSRRDVKLGNAFHTNAITFWRDPPMTDGFQPKAQFRSFYDVFAVSLNNLLTKLSNSRWFGTMWRSCDIIAI